MAWASLKLNDFPKHRLYLFSTVGLSAVFLVVKYFEYADHFARGEGPWHNTFLAIYFTLTGLHGIAAILPLYAVIAVICFVLLGRGQRGRMATTLAAAALAALWIWAIGLAPRTFDLPTQRDYLSRLWVRGANF